MSNEKIIVRYPPSPTGIAHIGNIRSFLFSFLVKEKNKGKAILRFEDTDKERSKKEYEKYILESLKDLGLTFEEGPYRQSERIEIYKKYLDKLIKSGSAYEAEESKDGSGDRVIRFKNPNKNIIFEDKIRGEIKINSSDFGDFVIARSKNNPLYHLTVVVDDLEMGVNYIIRGEDHITSTPRQILLIEALGGVIPTYAHLPLIVGSDGKKLSKRHGAVTWQEFKKEGYLPEGVVNYLALLGWHPKKGDEREIFSVKELIEVFKLEDVSKSPARFDYLKLKDINKAWMLKLEEEEYYQNFLSFLSDKLRDKFIFEKEKGEKIIFKVFREKISNFGEIKKYEEGGEFDYYFLEPEIEVEKMNFKNNSWEETKEYLKEIVKKIEDIPESDWIAENIKNRLWDWSGEKGRGNVLHPFRMSLSGKDRSPDPFIISEILGKKETLKRIKRYLN